MLSQSERDCLVEVALSTDQVTQSCKSVVQNDVHATRVYLVDCIAPGLDGSEVRVQDREIEGRVLIIPGWGIDEGRPGNVQSL